MNINSIQNQTSNYNFKSGRKLIPLKDYAGPILKLTKEDKAKIAKLQAILVEMETDFYALNKYMMLKKIIDTKSNDKYFYLSYEISCIKSQIDEIKRNRFNAQKTKFQTN